MLLIKFDANEQSHQPVGYPSIVNKPAIPSERQEDAMDSAELQVARSCRCRPETPVRQSFCQLFVRPGVVLDAMFELRNLVAISIAVV